jgi:Orsellinic acid/F9775 biosynthesis cluster protein D
VAHVISGDFRNLGKSSKSCWLYVKHITDCNVFLKSLHALNSVTMSVIEQHLLYIPQHHVVICRACQYCIKPNGAAKHLRRWHKELSLPVRKELEHYCNGLDLIAAEDIINPIDRVVIPGLELRNGNKCNVHGCHYVCSKESMVIAHARGHGWVLGNEKTWVKTHVQVCSLRRVDVDILCGA